MSDLATGQWFSPSTPVSSTNKTDSHDITEILLKVALNTINQTIHYIKNLSRKVINECVMFYMDMFYNMLSVINLGFFILWYMFITYCLNAISVSEGELWDKI